METDENPENLNLVDKVPEPQLADPIVELKSGIYNLFIGLYNNLIIDLGPEEAIRQSTAFLDEISYNFKKILTDYQESKLP